MLNVLCVVVETMISKIERARRPSQSQLVQIHNSSTRQFQLQLLLNLMNITITFFWHTRNNQLHFGGIHCKGFQRLKSKNVSILQIDYIVCEQFEPF
jgi:hypothetical protein